MRTSKAIHIVNILLFAFLAGCATKPIAIPSDFWKNKGEKIAIVLHRIPIGGGLYTEGSQGLIDIAINKAAMNEEEKYVSSLTADDFYKIGDIFSQELKALGYEVVIYDNKITIDDIEKIEKSTDGCFNRNISDIFNNTEASKIIILHLIRFGITRTYYGFIPTSDPKGFAEVQGLMIDKIDNKIIWDSGKLEGAIREPVIGDWNQRPDYPNLTSAIYRAIEKSKKFLQDRFFERS